MTSLNLYDVIGDIHSCCYELKLLFEKLEYELVKINGKEVYKHSSKVPIFVGDILDRGPGPVATYTLVRDMVQEGVAKIVRGNHDDKLLRFSQGSNVIQNHGLDFTIVKLTEAGIIKEDIKNFLESTPLYLRIDNFIITHGAWDDRITEPEKAGKRLRNWCLFAPTTGKTLPNGLPDRIDWTSNRKQTSPIIIYGHQPYKEVRVINGTYGIDTGCVFGGYLTAITIPNMEITQVKAHIAYDTSKPDLTE